MQRIPNPFALADPRQESDDFLTAPDMIQLTPASIAGATRRGVRVISFLEPILGLMP
jgi:hypothetical protein